MTFLAASSVAFIDAVSTVVVHASIRDTPAALDPDQIRASIDELIAAHGDCIRELT